MRKLHLFLALFFCLPAYVFAAENKLFSANQDCKCDFSVTDPYEEPIQFTLGSHHGECVDSCRFRRARILSEGETVVAANVLHQAQFMIAEIPVKDAVAIDILFEPFMAGASHVAFRVHFAKRNSIRLSSQSNAMPPLGPLFSDSIILSAEAALPKKGSLELVGSKSGAFLLDYRLTTIEEARRFMIGVKKHRVYQYRLKVPQEAVPRFLELALKRSQESSFQTLYDLTSNNCSTSAFDILDQATGNPPPTGMAGAERALPVPVFGTYRYLTYYGLIERQLPDLDVEQAE